MNQFPKNFVFGAATAAYQIEGASDLSLRGPSIWDTFTHRGGTIKDGTTGDSACDHYHRYREDVHHMAGIGLGGYRFSLSWPRILPDGTGFSNQAGIDFYDRLIDLLLEQGIVPYVTLYHWDLPQALQDKGGWANRDTARYFADYAAKAFTLYGDRIRHWVTFNEPWVATTYGCIEGIHAPGIQDLSYAFQSAHNMLLGHAMAVSAYRDSPSPQGEIGIVLNLHPCHSASESEKDQLAATYHDGFLNRWFLDPVFKGEYPEDMMRLYEEKGCMPEVLEGDLSLLKDNPVDFLGINYYFRFIVQHDDAAPLGFSEVKPTGDQVTICGWRPYPEGLLEILERVHHSYRVPKILITENGIAHQEQPHVHGQIEDDYRIDYIAAHLEVCLRAIAKGILVSGYFIWSLLDNFEWADGYIPRYGLIHTDHTTFIRSWKKSAYWYRDVIERRGLS
ncbi:MAG: beta-glucosidase [Spirochaetae bacterium HGW-Spirochaetae-4]|nr:MAG: beta-glucosidase [Spirochaetae bacterium HGW-Spirochaetae-8]PKL21435.1 MAG: beta-glucosidase [Spirochaetae bacterium HGW-Spirochaetae-4]